MNYIPEPDSDARVLPLIFLVDTSGSMTNRLEENGQKIDERRIDVVNANMRKLFNELGRCSSATVEYDVCIISFGTEAQCILDLCAAEQAQWQDLSADGQTNLAQALNMAKGIIEDRHNFPVNSYYPTVVLVSDGAPYPEDQGWEKALEDFCTTGRTAKCDRFAMGIGSGTNVEMLRRFINQDQDPATRLNNAQNAKDIIEFFRYVTVHSQTKAKTGVSPAQRDLPAASSSKVKKPFSISEPSAAPRKKNPFM